MKNKALSEIAQDLPRSSQTFTSEINAEIRRAAETGIYDIRAVELNVSYRILTIFFFRRFNVAIPLKVIVKNVKPTLH